MSKYEDNRTPGHLNYLKLKPISQRNMKLSKRVLKEAAKDGIPVYMAEQYNGTKLRFFCPYCYRYHGHGDPELKPFELTHRVPHCTMESAARKNGAHKRGYYLFYVPKNYKPPTFA